MVCLLFLTDNLQLLLVVRLPVLHYRINVAATKMLHYTLTASKFFPPSAFGRGGSVSEIWTLWRLIRVHHDFKCENMDCPQYFFFLDDTM